MRIQKLLILLSISSVPSACMAWPQYRMEIISMPTGTSAITSINNRGDVGIIAPSPTGTGFDNYDSYIRFSNGSKLLVPNASGYHPLSNPDINDIGSMTGYMVAIPEQTGIFGTSAGLYVPGNSTVALSRPHWQDQQYFPNAINNHNTVVGYGAFQDISEGPAFVWNYPGIADQEVPYFGDLEDINDSGTAVGMMYGRQPGYWNAATGAHMLPIATGLQYGRVDSINEAGWMAGFGFVYVGNNNYRSYLHVWNPAGELVTSVLTGEAAPRTKPNTGFTEAHINDLNQVIVGDIHRTGAPATVLLWSANTGLQQINPLIQGLPSGAVLSDPVGLNNRGQFSCYVYMNNHGYANVLFTPVPEPGSLAVLALGAVGLLKKRRKA